MEKRWRREQAENGITLGGACFLVSVPAGGWITIICSGTPVKMECVVTFSTTPPVEMCYWHQIQN